MRIERSRRQVSHRTHRPRAALASLAGAIACAVTPVATGQVNGSWVSPFNGSWSDAARWSSSPAYPDAGGAAVFNQGTISPTVTLDVPVSLGTLSVVGPGDARITGAGTLTFVGPAVLDVHGNSPAPPTYAPYSASSVGATVLATAAVTKTGPGAVTLFTNDAFPPITVTAGTLALSRGTSRTGLPSITLDGGALALVADPLGNAFLTQPVNVGPNGGTFAASNPLFDAIRRGVELFAPISGTGTANFVNANFPSSTQLDAANTYTGASYFLGGRSFLPGSIANSSEVVIDGTLVLQNINVGATGNKIGDDTPVRLRGGAFYGSTTVSEQIGNLTLVSGSSDVRGLFAVTNLVRENRATGTFAQPLTVQGAGPSMIGLGAPGTPTVGVVPWASSGGAPMTFDAGVLRPLADAEVVTTLPVGSTAYNVRLPGAATYVSSAPVTVNSLSVGTGAFCTGVGTISVTSGAVHGAGQVDCPLDFGAAEGVVGVGTISGPISGSGDVTFFGDTTVSGTSDYTGPTTINGIVRLTRDVPAVGPGPLGSDTSPVVLRPNGWNGSGKISFAGPAGSTISFGRDIHVLATENQPAGLSASSPAVVTGNVTLDGPLDLAGIGAGGTLTIAGKISGSSFITSRGNELTLSGDNDFTGGVRLLNVGDVTVGNDHALGSGTLWVAGGGALLRAGGAPRTINNPVAIYSGMVLIAQASSSPSDQPLTLAGPVDLTGGQRSVQVGGSIPATITGEVSNGTLTKIGNGTLRMRDIRLSGVNVAAGTVALLSNGGSAGASKVQSLIVSTGAALDLTNNAMVVDYDTGATSPLLDVRGLIGTGFNGGNWLGKGVTSSAAASAPPTRRTALGYAEAAVLGATNLDGQSADATSVLIRYTLAGDADLDRTVDMSDFTRLAANFNQTGRTWVEGDFNYDGSVDLTDFAFLAANFNQSLAASDIGVAAIPSVGQRVPEPGACAALMSLVMPALLSRRARRRMMSRACATNRRG